MAGACRAGEKGSIYEATAEGKGLHRRLAASRIRGAALFVGAEHFRDGGDALVNVIA